MARFFIDRPIFAWVISIVIVLVGLVAAGLAAGRAVSGDHAAHGAGDVPTIPAPTPRWWPTPWPRRSSSRSTASRTCCTCRRRCTNDGAYNLTVTFELGTDLDMAQVLVQNRVVAWPCPRCPTWCKAIGRDRQEEVAEHPAGGQPVL